MVILAIEQAHVITERINEVMHATVRVQYDMSAQRTYTMQQSSRVD